VLVPTPVSEVLVVLGVLQADKLMATVSEVIIPKIPLYTLFFILFKSKHFNL